MNLIHGDSRVELKKFPDKYFDLIITDPPYGIGYAEYDDADVFFELEKEMYRVLKDDAWFVFWWSNKRLLEVKRLSLFKYKWQMMCIFPRTYSKSPLGDRTYAPIMVFQKGNPKLAYRRSDSVLAEELPFVKSRVKSGDFKPTFALSQLLLMFSKENDKILDSFMGFGSFGLVCKIFKRDFTGIEMQENRFKIAKKIIESGGINKPIPALLKDMCGKTGIQKKLKLR